MTVHEPAYREITLEFLTTFKLDLTIITNDDARRISFCFMGIRKFMSTKYNTCLQMMDDANELEGTLDDYPEEFNENAFWIELTLRHNYKK